MEFDSYLSHFRRVFGTDGAILVAGMLLAAVIFGIDLSLPLGVAGGVPYVVPVLLCVWIRHPSRIYLMAIIGSALTVAGYFLSAEGGTQWVVLTNRSLAIFAIWAVALLGARRIQQLIEQQKYEAVLSEKEENIRRYAHIVSSANDMLALLDKQYFYLAASDAFVRACGRTSDEIIGHTIADVFGDEFFNATIKPRADRCLGGEVTRYRNWFEFEKIGRRYMDVTYSPYLGPNAEILGFAVNAKDITEQKQADEDLRKSEIKYRTIVNTTNEGYWRVNEEMEIVEANDAICRMLGYKREEILGKRPSDFATEADAPDYQEMLAETLKIEERAGERQWEGKFRRKDGALIDVHNSGTDFIDQDGKPNGRFAFISNITDRRKASEALLRSEERYQHLINSAEVSIWDEDFTAVLDALEGLRNEGVDDLWRHLVENPDLVGELASSIRINGVNTATLKLFGSASEDAFTSSINKTFDIGSRRVFVDELCAIWRGESRFRAETSLLTLAGKKLDVVISMPLPKTREEARSVPISIFDITDRKEAEAAIIESEERFRTVFDTIETGTMVIDTSGVIQIFNPAAQKIFGYEPDEILGKNVSMLMPEPDRGRHNDYIQNYIKTGEAKVICIGRQVKGLRKGGEEFPMQLEIGEMKIGNETCFVGSIADLTALQSLESQLRQAQKLEAVGQLTGGIAHDFNNLLAVIHGNLSLLVEDLGAGNEVEKDDPMELIMPAIEASRRGAELTQRLLAFSRKQILEPRILSLNNLVTGMENLLRRTLGETINLRVDLKGSAWQVMIDPSQLENALLNLTLNARDAMPDGGRLTIRRDDVRLDKAFVAKHPGSSIGDFAMLAVSDTGTGMTEEILGKVFDPFFTTKGVGIGSGLGLSMVHGFVKQSGGYIEIISEPGEGASVILYLPRSLEKEVVVEKPEAAPYVGGQETILVVEDEKEVRRVTVRMLRRFGYQVFEAGSGKAALNLLAGGDSIDLLLTDVVLPGGMNGPKIAHAARKIKPGMKVLFMSGYTKNLDVHEGRIDEGVPLLSKPFSQAELALRVRETLDAVT